MQKAEFRYSVGVRVFRVGKDTRVRSYAAASILGTGLYNLTYSNSDVARPQETLSSDNVLERSVKLLRSRSSLSFACVRLPSVLA
jgi:hypothetical protein